MLSLRIDAAYYGKSLPVIRAFSLTARKGARICLKGPSGAGKTTILKIIAGLHKDFKGEINLDGARTAYAPQATGLLPWKRVINNIMLLGETKNRVRAIELLKNLGLEKFERRFPAELSGGQRQRIALLQALYFEPNILLLDESFSALDGVSKLEAQEVLDEFLKETDCLLIMVSHNDSEAEFLNCKTVYVGNEK